jgi:hypothetical protein
MNVRRLLIIEDGAEYTEAFRRIAAVGAPAPVTLRAGDAAEARQILSEQVVDAVFVDMVFDRTPPERLAGDLDALVARYGGDRRLAQQHLARNQGFYVLSELAPLLGPAVRIVLAWDFSSEPGRLDALRERLPGLTGLAEGTPITRVLETLLKVPGQPG